MEGWAKAASLLAASLIPLTATGCSTVVDAAAGVFGPSGVRGAVDAHVVYRLRPDCPTLLARSINNGYTVLTPREALAAPGVPEFLGSDVEETGVFEGPVREGEVVFRYIAPAASETWAAGPVDVVADVAAVGLTQAEGSAVLLDLCGPLPEPPPPPPAPAPIPRTPAQ